MKHQALFSSKDKSEIIKGSSATIFCLVLKGLKPKLLGGKSRTPVISLVCWPKHEPTNVRDLSQHS